MFRTSGKLKGKKYNLAPFSLEAKAWKGFYLIKINVFFHLKCKNKIKNEKKYCIFILTDISKKKERKWVLRNLINMQQPFVKLHFKFYNKIYNIFVPINKRSPRALSPWLVWMFFLLSAFSKLNFSSFIWFWVEI